MNGGVAFGGDPSIHMISSHNLVGHEHPGR